jgi:hypothetical protein
MRIKGMVCAAALCGLLSGAAHAFDAASDPTAPGGPGDPAARSARSLQCSQKADAQNLHGKPRRHFMRECKHGG